MRKRSTLVTAPIDIPSEGRAAGRSRAGGTHLTFEPAR